MKKFYLLLMSIILLSACGSNVHENISEEIAADTEDVIEIFDNTIEEERGLNEREEKIFEAYLVKYGSRYDNPELAVEKLTKEETTLYVLTMKMIEMYDYHTTLTTNQEDFEDTKNRIRRVIETGSISE